ncbi:Hsp20/alpha crystallin family protein [Candidatus Entotheonella palauensis]|uniref:Hsp20/alpha crystallin family protein n=1 Tax=Candidatus Entotheonella palauensis TaxID=93172 RepID=UPI0015C43B4B|nr:Hsp20/alpha crystallin family protein [Candidatus Entotheonella palauensis]
MTYAYALKGMRSLGDFHCMWYPNDSMNPHESVLAHQTVSHIYPEGELQVEFVEKTDAYWLIAELPDIQQDDITVGVEGDTLSLLGEWPEEAAANGSAQLVRPYRAFARKFQLDEPVEADAISMTYSEGILAVCVPKQVPSGVETHDYALVEN